MGRPSQHAANHPSKRDADIVIVGGGLAGLSAAYHLRDLEPMVLEREPRCGGRVWTARNDGVTYEMGAAFGFRKEWLPFGLELSLPYEDAPLIGLLTGGRLFTGESPGACIVGALDGDRPAKSAGERALRDAFLHVIHAGDPDAYSPKVRERSATSRYAIRRRRAGNAELVAFLASQLHPAARLSMPARVVADEGASVSVSVRHNGESVTFRAKAVVVATTAPEAAALVPDMEPAVRDYLGRVRYARVAVIAIGVRARLPELAYVVTPDAPMDMVLLQRTGNPELGVVTCYFGDRAAAHLDDQPESDRIERTIAALGPILGLDVARAIEFTRIKTWRHGGTVVSSDLSIPGTSKALSATGRIVLAGDYLAAPNPYGMRAALASGEAAAGRVRRALEDD